MKNVKEIEFKVEGKKWENLLDKAFKKKSKDTQVDGFRKGNCPKEVFIKKFGIESLYMEASEMAIDEAYKSVLEENKLHYKIISDNIIDIYDEINISEFVIALSQRNCKINKFQEKEETLEKEYDYFD